MVLPESNDAIEIMLLADNSDEAKNTTEVDANDGTTAAEGAVEQAVLDGGEDYDYSDEDETEEEDEDEDDDGAGLFEDEDDKEEGGGADDEQKDGEGDGDEGEGEGEGEEDTMLEELENPATVLPYYVVEKTDWRKGESEGVSVCPCFMCVCVRVCVCDA